jgi:hypothetical protein
MLILEYSQGCYVVNIWPSDLDLWPWKSIGFQILLKTKYVPSLVKIHWRMLILECSQGCYGRTDTQKDGSVTISLRNFVGEGIIRSVKYCNIHLHIYKFIYSIEVTTVQSETQPDKYTIYVHCRKIQNLLVRALETGRKRATDKLF